MVELERITRNPEIMGGRPCIRGMRVTVSMIVDQLAAGYSVEDIIYDYPYLERKDVLQALRFASSMSRI